MTQSHARPITRSRGQPLASPHRVCEVAWKYSFWTRLAPGAHVACTTRPATRPKPRPGLEPGTPSLRVSERRLGRSRAGLKTPAKSRPLGRGAAVVKRHNTDGHGERALRRPGRTECQLRAEQARVVRRREKARADPASRFRIWATLPRQRRARRHPDWEDGRLRSTRRSRALPFGPVA
jgi:hypothetical protein